MSGAKNFKSKGAYNKYVAYVKMHPSIDKPGGAPVKIAGKSHKVDRGGKQHGSTKGHRGSGGY